MDDNCWTVYMHICPNGKKYVGITKQNTKKRWGYGRGYKTNILFYRAIQKYGWENIDHKIIIDSISESSAKQIEKFLIANLDLSNPLTGYNILPGGEVQSFPIEVRKKMSDARKKRLPYKLSEDHKRHIGERSSYNIAIGKIPSINDNPQNYIWTNERKQKLSNSLRKTLGKPISQFDCSGIHIADYGSLAEAEENTGIKVKNISYSLRHAGHTAGGYIWKYAS